MTKQAERSQSVSFIEAVLLRPRMYTLTGGFEEAICFIDGFFGGVAKGNYQDVTMLEWESFKGWLSKETGVPVRDVFLQFRDKAPGNGQAFAEVLERLAEFRADRA